MKSLRFRAPGRGGVLRELLKLAWPHCSDRQLHAALRSGSVRLGRRPRTDGTERVPPGALILADVPAGEHRPRPPELVVLARGEDYCVVDKPVGWPSHAATPAGLDARALVASRLDRPVETVWPAHRLDADVSGVWLIALTREAAARLSLAFEQQRVKKEYRALAPRLAWPAGTLRGAIDSRPAATRYAVVRELGPVAEYALWPETGRTHQLRLHLSDAGSPLLGDGQHGGVALAGGLRLYSRRILIESEGIDVRVPEPPRFGLAVPPEQILPPLLQAVELVVSKASVAALRRGHPWILTDSETSDTGGYRPGTPARVRDRSGQEAGICLIEGSGRIAARVWSRRAGSERAGEIGRRVARALEQREPLLRSLTDTDAFRLVHGEADRLPGLAVDLLAGQLRVLLLSRCAEPLVEPVLDALLSRLSNWLPPAAATDPPAVLVTHLAVPIRGELLRVRALRGRPGSERFLIRERQLVYEVCHGLDDPYRSRPGIGLYLDQRRNRRRIGQLIADHGGGRWLNLFAHTGGFSVAALAAGADQVVSVDLSRAYLAQLERNLEQNRLDGSRHSSVRLDARRYLSRLEKGRRFDGIILDPPTAAASGQRFWSLRKQLPELVATCLGRIVPGGHLLVCRNARDARPPLSAVLSKASKACGVRCSEVKSAGPGRDFPRLSGFPEGDAFQGLLARIQG